MKNPVATYPLKYPIEFGKDKVIDMLEFRRVQIGDLRASQNKDEIEAGLIILGRITDLTPAQIDRLDVEDMEGAMEIVEGFMPKSRKDGEESSSS
ncbi:MAG: phage tail assembly protein [Planctomycetaceae bacterium]|nr:phage tail assembly protein [Planctomycetaceae bacterium]